jgi:hypothetical protein
MEWTLKEAAETLEISVKALRYRIKANGLAPRVIDGAHGPQYVLNEEQLGILGRVPKEVADVENIPGVSGPRSRAPEEGPQHFQNRPEDAQYRSGDGLRVVPVEVHLETQEALREALELSREQRVDRLDAERRAEEAEERALRIARQAQALAEELGAQKRLLAENAESLMERRAQVQQYEARVEEVASREAETQRQLEELYRHNAEEKARYEREREEMLEKLKLSEAKASRFERMPRWVTKLFGT